MKDEKGKVSVHSNNDSAELTESVLKRAIRRESISASNHKPFDVLDLYEDWYAVAKDPRAQISTYLKSKIKREVEAAAQAQGYGIAEYVRRALWIVNRHPSLLQEADAMEKSYQAMLGPSRWHSKNSNDGPEAD